MRRPAVYGLVVAFGIIPCTHWYARLGGNALEASMFLPRVAIAYLFAAVGVSFYITKFPECCIPGRVDIVGSSHQWWHGFVTLGFFSWYRSGVQMLEFRASHACPPLS